MRVGESETTRRNNRNDRLEEKRKAGGADHPAASAELDNAIGLARLCNPSEKRKGLGVEETKRGGWGQHSGTRTSWTGFQFQRLGTRRENQEDKKNSILTAKPKWFRQWHVRTTGKKKKTDNNVGGFAKNTLTLLNMDGNRLFCDGGGNPRNVRKDEWKEHGFTDGV